MHAVEPSPVCKGLATERELVDMGVSHVANPAGANRGPESTASRFQV